MRCHLCRGFGSGTKCVVAAAGPREGVDERFAFLAIVIPSAFDSSRHATAESAVPVKVGPRSHTVPECPAGCGAGARLAWGDATATEGWVKERRGL